MIDVGRLMVDVPDFRPRLMILCLMCFLHQNLSLAQRTAHPIPTIIHPTSTFKNITTQLGANAVRAINQDAKGVVWIGTETGLYYYDGFNAHVRHDATAAEKTIHSILPYDDEHLYIGTSDGLQIFNLPSQRYEEIPTAFDELHEVRALKMFSGELWIGTKENGLFSYDTKTGKLTRHNSADGRKIPFIFCMEAVGDRLFIGGYDGLYERNATDGKIVRIAIDGDRRTMVNSLLWNSADRRLLVGTEGLLYSYDPMMKTIVATVHGKGNSIKSIAKDSRGNLLLATDAGLCVYDKAANTERFVIHDSRNQYTLANDVVWQIFIDREANVWLATGRGVSLSPSRAKLKTVSLAELTGRGMGNQISIISKDAAGDYWLGGENGLIHVRGNGVVDWFRADDARHALRHNHIRDIFEDSGGVMWIASDGGIARYDGKADRFVYYDISAKTAVANTRWSYDICEDTDGNLWIATFVGGVFAVSRAQLLAHDASKPLTIEPIDISVTGGSAHKLATSDRRTICAATKDGLVAIDAKTAKATRTGKPNTDISEYAPEEWTVDNGKIYRRQGDKRQEVAYSAVASGIVGGSMSVYDDRDNGILIIGGNDCVAMIPTSDFQQSSMGRRVYIASLSAGGIDLMPQVDFTLEYANGRERMAMTKRDNIQVELSTFDYATLSSTVFYYRIDNKQWSCLERGQNKLLLAELPGGNHTLQVSTANPDDDSQAVISTYEISMPYPWYASPVAKVVYALALLAIACVLFLAMHRKSIARYERREREKTMELSAMKMDFFEKISHELKTPLSLIIAPLGTVMEETKAGTALMDNLKTIHENAMRLDSLVNKILGIRTADSNDDAQKNITSSEHKLTEADEVFLGKVVKAIDQNMATDGFGVQQLANIVGVDQKQLYRKVKQLTDQTPINYIRKLKMKRAAALLDQQRFSVSEVMYMVGFTSSSYFSKCFADEYGMTPKNYANRENAG